MSDFILVSHESVTVEFSASSDASHSLDEAAQLAGIDPHLLRKYCDLGLLGESRVQADTEPVFDDAALYEIRRIEHYRLSLKVDLHALPVVYGLVQEVERLRAEVRMLRDG